MLAQLCSAPIHILSRQSKTRTENPCRRSKKTENNNLESSTHGHSQKKEKSETKRIIRRQKKSETGRKARAVSTDRNSSNLEASAFIQARLCLGRSRSCDEIPDSQSRQRSRSSSCISLRRHISSSVPAVCATAAMENPASADRPRSTAAVIQMMMKQLTLKPVGTTSASTTTKKGHGSQLPSVPAPPKPARKKTPRGVLATPSTLRRSTGAISKASANNRLLQSIQKLQAEQLIGAEGGKSTEELCPSPQNQTPDIICSVLESQRDRAESQDDDEKGTSKQVPLNSDQSVPEQSRSKTSTRKSTGIRSRMRPLPVTRDVRSLINSAYRRRGKVGEGLEGGQGPSVTPIEESPFGYDIGDTEAFLSKASFQRPASLPMVVTQNVTLLQTTMGDRDHPEEVHLAMGIVVSAVYKQGGWLYVRTPHGSEGFIPYAACLPLGIVPPDCKEINNDIGTAGAQGIPAPWELGGELYLGPMRKSKPTSHLSKRPQEQKPPVMVSESVVDAVLKDLDHLSKRTKVKGTSASGCRLKDPHRKKKKHSNNTLTESQKTIPEETFSETENSKGDSENTKDTSSNQNTLVTSEDNISNDSITDETAKSSDNTSSPKLPYFNKTDTQKLLEHVTAAVSMPTQAPPPVPSSPPVVETVEVEVVCDYVAKGRNTVSVQKGQTIQILSHHLPDWVWVRTASGEEGFVPTAYTALEKQCYL